MIDPEFFYKKLSVRGTEFFTGVPDSLLKSFCAFVTDHAGEKNHIIAVNEGAAVALASGYHLATGKTPLVYMQNSGIGNAVNPLLSLADGDVYRIPMILLIGWRGEPGVKDEPQHLKQGKATCDLLKAMDIPFCIISGQEDELDAQLEQCYGRIARDNTPFALVARKDTFASYGYVQEKEGGLSREKAIEEIILSSSPEEIFFTTTGMASRELYELREKHRMSHERDFLTVGSMGHASSLALSFALQRPGLPVTCLDGDGAVLMHMGALAAIAVLKPANLRHIILNNGAHDSVGGQPTIALNIDILGIAAASGYKHVFSAANLEELRRLLGQADNTKGRKGPLFIEVKVRKGARKDLGRPRSSPQKNKKALMDAINSFQNKE